MVKLLTTNQHSTTFYYYMAYTHNIKFQLVLINYTMVTYQYVDSKF